MILSCRSSRSGAIHLTRPVGRRSVVRACAAPELLLGVGGVPCVYIRQHQDAAVLQCRDLHCLQSEHSRRHRCCLNPDPNPDRPPLSPPPPRPCPPCPTPPSLLTRLLAAGVADWLFLGRELPNTRSRHPHAPHAPHGASTPLGSSLSPCSVRLLWQSLDARPRSGCWLIHVHRRIVHCAGLPVRPQPRPPPPASHHLAPSPHLAALCPASTYPAHPHTAPHRLAPPRTARL